MAKITWTFKNEEGTNLNRYIATNVSTGEKITFDLLRGGNISVVGTPLNAENLNALITAINACYDLIESSEKDTTYTLSKNGNAIRLTSSSGAINDVTLAKEDVGLSKVDNTSDMDKPISTAQKKALDLKADKKDVSEVDIDLEGTGTIVSIPENTTGYGTIEKLGGKSYKSENLLVLKDVVETTTNGITYSVKDGVITLNGTASAVVTINMTSNLGDSGAYAYNGFVSGVRSGNIAMQFNYDYAIGIDKGTISNYITNQNVRIYIYSGASFTNYQIKPMFVSGNVIPTEFSQGFKGIKIEYPTNVKVVGRNLFNFEVEQGAIFSNLGYDYSNLKASDNTRIRTTNLIDLDNSKTYTISVASDYKVVVQPFTNDGKYASNSIPFNTWTNSITFSGYPKYAFAFKKTSEKNITPSELSNVQVMLNIGSTALPYTSYTEQNLPQTSIINYVSNQLQTNHSWTQDNASKWLGLGVGNDSNIINYANNKKGDVKYSIVDLGTFNYTRRSDLTNVNCFSSNQITGYLHSTLVKALCYKYKFVGVVESYQYMDYEGDKCFALYYSEEQPTTSIIYINDSDYTDATTLKNSLNGVMLIYELATPIEIDLSSLETEEHFECESNGSIIHDNIANYKYSFPVSLKGQVELNFEHDKEQQRDIDSLKKEIDLKANKSETYTKEETNALIDSIVAGETGLTNYYTKSETNKLLNDKANKTDVYTKSEINNELSKKVDKVDGKGLSANDFTNDLKSKLENVDNTKDSDKNVASAKVLKNNTVYDFDISSGITPYSIDLNDNHVYLIYNDHWSFVMRVNRPNDNNYSQSTVCINESNSKPVWFIYQNAKLKLKTTKVVNSNTFVVVEENYNGKFYYKLLATD